MRRAVGALAAAAIAVLAGCGVPDDERPQVIAADDAFVDLAPTTTVVQEVGDDQVAVFFIDRSGERPVLASVLRSVTAVNAPTALEQLLLGPRPDDPEGLTSAIPSGTALLGTSVDENGTLTIDLAPTDEGGLLSVQGTTQLEAFAQIVRTVTGVPSVRNVRFEVGGEAIEAPTDEGPTSDPVVRADYASLVPG